MTPHHGKMKRLTEQKIPRHELKSVLCFFAPLGFIMNS